MITARWREITLFNKDDREVKTFVLPDKQKNMSETFAKYVEYAKRDYTNYLGRITWFNVRVRDKMKEYFACETYYFKEVK